MSEENVEIVRRSAEEFNRGGVEAMIDTYWAPDIVWDMTNAGVPGVGVYTGYDEVRAFVADWFSAFKFDEWKLEVDELIDCKRRLPESNRCKRLCRPLRSHSATAPGARPILVTAGRA